MRLFLLLATVLIAASDGWKFKDTPRTHYQLPNSSLPLKDGSIITIYFFQNSSTYLDVCYPAINFYNKPSVIVDEEQFLTAQVWTTIGNKFEVLSGSQWKGHSESMYYQQDMSEMPHPTGWWRFDLLKHNSSHATLFIQGCYAGVRKFDPLSRLPLDDIMSIYLMCRSADHSTVQMSVKSPNAAFAPMTVEKFESFLKKSDENWATDKPLISFPNFPVGTRIEMIAVMRAWSDYTPALIFKPKSGADFFLKIYQEWVQVHDVYREQYEGTHELHIQSGQDERFPETKPMGELQHLRIERTEEDVVTMTQLFFPGDSDKPGYLADESEDNLDLHTISVYVHEKELMDGPFQIMSHNGALILHLEHNIPIKKN